jgi:sporulation protein YlmC with PRC-barrel domain
MNKLIKCIALMSVFGLVLLGSYAFATEDVTPYPPANWTPLEASYLIGHRVYDYGNRDLGTIDDLVIDQTHDRVALVVLSDVPGFGAERVAIPYGLFNRTPGGWFTINFPPDTELGYFGGERSPYLHAFPGAEYHGTVDSFWIDSVYSSYGVAPYWKEGALDPGFQVYSYSSSLGAEAQFAQGGRAGRIYDLVLDHPDGHVNYVLLSDVPGREDAMVAVPFSAFSRENDQMFALNFTGDRLASAPGFDESRDLSSRAYADSVYRHFGIQPYWTDDGMHEGDMHNDDMY